MPEQDYHLANIRNLLHEGFTDEEIYSLCYDLYASIYKGLKPEINKELVVRLLLEQANRRLEVETLLDWAKLHNRARYEKHQPYYLPGKVVPLRRTRSLRYFKDWLENHE